MKKAKHIIESIQLQPQFKKLKDFACIKKVLNMFIPSLHKFILFSYIRNKTIYIVLNHNAAKQEFDNNIKMIKEVLNDIKPQECNDYDNLNIVTFVSYKVKKNINLKKTPIITVPTYKERSKGKFDTNIFKDERLLNSANEIKNIIKANNASRKD